MEQVGVRELKNRLGHYLRTVRQGQSIVVTVRGQPVARLVPILPLDDLALPSELETRLWDLATKGLLTWQGGSFQLPQPAAVNRSQILLSELVIEDRE